MTTDPFTDKDPDSGERNLRDTKERKFCLRRHSGCDRRTEQSFINVTSAFHRQQPVAPFAGVFLESAKYRCAHHFSERTCATDFPIRHINVMSACPSHACHHRLCEPPIECKRAGFWHVGEQHCLRMNSRRTWQQRFCPIGRIDAQRIENERSMTRPEAWANDVVTSAARVAAV